MLEADVTPSAVTAWLEKTAVRQFVKFCIIGFSSMILDAGIAWVLTFGSHWNGNMARVVSFSVAVTNGFIWNSLWTFRGLGSGARHAQYAKFVAVNIVGLGLNLAIMNGVYLLATGHLISAHPIKQYWCVAMGVAVVCVSLFNFLANKYYTFRPASGQS